MVEEPGGTAAGGHLECKYAGKQEFDQTSARLFLRAVFSSRCQSGGGTFSGGRFTAGGGTSTAPGRGRCLLITGLPLANMKLSFGIYRITRTIPPLQNRRGFFCSAALLCSLTPCCSHRCRGGSNAASLKRSSGVRKLKEEGFPLDPGRCDP